MSDRLNTYDIILRHFDQLSNLELYGVLKLRHRVFVLEQQITSEPEIDGKDTDCHHVIARLPDTGDIYGTARVFFARTPAKIGRLAVHPDHRNRGLGTRIMKYLHTELETRERDGVLFAQYHLRNWYQTRGWRSVGEMFYEAGIRHIKMVRKIDETTG